MLGIGGAATCFRKFCSQSILHILDFFSDTRKSIKGKGKYNNEQYLRTNFKEYEIYVAHWSLKLGWLRFRILGIYLTKVCTSA
jgi:hypothetical protein